MALAAAHLALNSAFAGPALTGAEARAFLGGRTGKIVYCKNYDYQMYFVDLSDSVLVEHKIADDMYVQSPMIHPDGSRIVYESGSTIWIRDLVENSTVRYPVFSRPVKPSQTMEPHWWIDPKTGFEYITWITGDMQDGAWPPQSSGTYIQKIVNNKPEGAPLLLMPFMMSTGRSRDGRWGASAHHSVGMYKLLPDSIQKAYSASKNWLDSGSLLACNGSISPSKDPTRQNRMMHLTSGGTSMGGVPYDNHKAVIIRSWNDVDLNHPFWWMGVPGDRSNNDGSGNLFWGAPEWSNDENYFTATGSKDIDALDTADLYMIRINYTGDSQLMRVVTGAGKNVMSNMWIKDGVLPAKLRLDKISLAFTALKKDSANPPAQVVNVSNAGDGTLPSLKLGATPSWLKVTITGDGSNAPVLTNAVLRDSVKPGDYQAKVTVSFGQLADSVSYTVSFKYSDPVLTTLKPIPSEAMLLPGDSIQLKAVGLDQTGALLSPQPSVTWSGTGSLKPSADGWFRADTAVWKSYLAIASGGGLACTTTVTLVKNLLRVDAAGVTGKLPSGWVGDAAYVTGGTSVVLGDSAVALSNVSDPAPDTVYRTYRSGAPAYRFDSLPDGRYEVRFHFTSPVDSPSALGTMATLQGVKVLDDYHPPAKPAKGLQGDLRNASVTVSDGKGLQIGFSGGSAYLAGLEIFNVGPEPVSLISPNGGESFAIGDTVSIRWKTDETINSVGIQVTVDSGKTWLPITRTRAVAVTDSDWGDFAWVIPDTLDGTSLIGNKAMISVYGYFGTARDRSNRAFTIVPGPFVNLKHAPLSAEAHASLEGGRLRLFLPEAGDYRCVLIDRRGRLVRDFNARGGDINVALPSLSRGLYTLVIQSSGSTRTGRVRYLNLPFLF